MGVRTFVLGGGRLLLSGLWSSQVARSWQTGNEMFKNAKLGLNLPLDGGVGAPIAPTYDADCDTDLTACLRVDLQPLDGKVGWVASQGESTRVAVLAADGAIVRTIDVRSREFLRDGTKPAEGTEAQIAWGTTNSTIWGLYGAADIIAVIHVRNASKDWQRGQVVQFDVFMNLYSVDGDRLVSDIRLPGLPAGSDNGQLLVLDYGSLGRRANATQIEVKKVPIRAGWSG